MNKLAPEYADLSAAEKALIKRGGAVCFERLADGSYQKTLRQPNGSTQTVAGLIPATKGGEPYQSVDSRLHNAQATLAKLRQRNGF